MFIFAAFIVLFTVVMIAHNFAPTPPTDEAAVDSNKNLEQVSNDKSPAVSDVKVETDKKLQGETDALLSLFNNMPSVPIYIKDEPILKSGTNVEKGVAHTVCESKNNPIIYVKKIFYQKANRKQLVNILKHELTHAWFCRQGITADHDARFRKKFKEVGGFGN